MNSMQEDKSTPKLRLGNAVNEWDKEIIKDICNISTGKSNTQDRVDDGKYPFYVRSSKIERSNRFLFNEEAVLTVGDGVGTGKVYHYVNGKYDLHQRVYRMYNFRNINAKYFYYFFSINFYKRVMGMTAKTSVDSVRLEMIADMDIYYPDLKEQDFIASVLTNLDNLISHHQKKHEKLSTLKKAMLEKMFPKKGADVPEIRFKNFTKPWKELSLGTNSHIVAGGTPSTAIRKYWEPKQIHWMSSGEVHKKRLYNTYNKISKEGLNNSSATFIKQNSVLIALAGQGKTRGTVAINKIKLTTNQSIAAIIPNEKINYEFLFQNLESRYEELRLKSSGDGSRGGLNKEIISKLRVKCPDVDEQIKIGEFLKTVDKLIHSHHFQIIKLQDIKDSFLSRMFV